VLQRAKKLNYQMNWVARSLVTRRTYTIGILLPEFAHPFFAEIARAVARTVRPHGYCVVISSFEEDPTLEASEIDSLLARQVDGLIIASSQPSRRLSVFKKIEARKTPYVLIDRPIAGVGACFVGVDNQAIGRLATEHLIAKVATGSAICVVLSCESPRSAWKAIVRRLRRLASIRIGTISSPQVIRMALGTTG